MAHQEQTIGERAGGAVAVEVDGRERGGEALRDDGADEVVGRDTRNSPESSIAIAGRRLDRLVLELTMNVSPWAAPVESKRRPRMRYCSSLDARLLHTTTKAPLARESIARYR
jgi:hypothetical protein